MAVEVGSVVYKHNRRVCSKVTVLKIESFTAVVKDEAGKVMKTPLHWLCEDEDKCKKDLALSLAVSIIKDFSNLKNLLKVLDTDKLLALRAAARHIVGEVHERVVEKRKTE